MNKKVRVFRVGSLAFEEFTVTASETRDGVYIMNVEHPDYQVVVYPVNEYYLRIMKEV